MPHPLLRNQEQPRVAGREDQEEHVLIRRLVALAAAGSLALAAAALLVLPAAPATAQEVVQDEGSAYRAWHDASQKGDVDQAIEAAKAYLEKYPTGQYADFLKKWLADPALKMARLEAAIKAKRTSDMIAIGREILAAD